jgi:hypothetical protein
MTATHARLPAYPVSAAGGRMGAANGPASSDVRPTWPCLRDLDPGRQAIARAMTETQLQTAVLDRCRVYQLRAVHFRPARTAQGWRTPVQADGAGWPDATIVGSKLIIRELKAQGAYPTAGQRVWLDALTAAGIDACVWKPVDLLTGRIDHELSAISRKVNR